MAETNKTGVGEGAKTPAKTPAKKNPATVAPSKALEAANKKLKSMAEASKAVSAKNKALEAEIAELKEARKADAATISNLEKKAKVKVAKKPSKPGKLPTFEYDGRNFQLRFHKFAVAIDGAPRTLEAAEVAKNAELQTLVVEKHPSAIIEL